MALPKELSERTKAEMAAGHAAVRKSAVAMVVGQVALELAPGNSNRFSVDQSNPNHMMWEVVVDFGGTCHRELYYGIDGVAGVRAFPSDELRAKILLAWSK